MPSTDSPTSRLARRASAGLRATAMAVATQTTSLSNFFFSMLQMDRPLRVA
jgi:hypothetical protein